MVVCPCLFRTGSEIPNSLDATTRRHDSARLLRILSLIVAVAMLATVEAADAPKTLVFSRRTLVALPPWWTHLARPGERFWCKPTRFTSAPIAPALVDA